MHKSSPSIATLAGALAKAQLALVNPEKTMTATVRGGRTGEGPERSFRYAPLSAGLDIVRQTLGKHEIAVVQTTELDQSNRTLHLNTVLAHSSGEWIASDWPVCPLSDLSSPQRMGAALTYARRYGLFTLVGIAGDDDLDAPDLIHVDPGPPSAGLSAKPNGKLSGAVAGPLQSRPKAQTLPTLPAVQSAELRDTLLRQIGDLAGEPALSYWAAKGLAAKNRLVADDARTVERAFEAKLKEFPLESVDAEAKAGQGAAMVPQGEKPTAQRIKPPNVELPIAKPVRRRDREHLKFVGRQACLVCGRQPSDPHHLRFAQGATLGRKASDEFTVPLCRLHHRELHRARNERQWWQTLGFDPLLRAKELWLQSHPTGPLEQNGNPTEPVEQHVVSLAMAMADPGEAVVLNGSPTKG